MNHRRFPSSLFPLPIIFVLQVMLGFPQSLGNLVCYKACRDAQFICGSISAGYPFSGPGIPLGCGHPGLQLECENDTPTIYIVDSRYQVLDINPDRQTLRVMKRNLINNDFCDQTNAYSSLDYSTRDYGLFDFVNGSCYANVTLLYDCHNLTQTFLEHLNCSIDIYDFPDVWVVSEVIGSVPCSYSVTVPIVPSSLAGIRNYSSIPEDLEGFEVKWKQDSQECQKCKETGGACGFGSTNQTICFCANTHILEELTECPSLTPAATPQSDETLLQGT
ncbi:hypothetical protein CRYUN_Cryun01aG0093500 [Craigia yunnanensis]